MSAAPLIEKKQLQAKKIKMAMALKGKNVHYLWYNIQRRHFLETANNVHYSEEKAEVILDEMLNQVEPVIKKISVILPPFFPKNISSPVFECRRQMKTKLAKKTSNSN